MAGLTYEYLEALKKDELIMKVMPVFAYHSYHSDNDYEARMTFKKNLVLKNTELRFDMSEWCELPNKSPTDSFKAALITARIIGQDLILAGAESWTSWVAVNQISVKEDGKDYGDGLFGATDDFSQWLVAKRYYGMAHFTKYIPVGSVCLDAGNLPESENTLNAFSFLTPENKTVIVIVNEGEKSTVSIEGNFRRMKIVSSCENEFLQTKYDGNFKQEVSIDKNHLLTVICE